MFDAWTRVGNASSPHSAGFAAAVAVDTARSQVAQLIGSDATEIIFTSGATEANNLAILGVGNLFGPSPRSRIVVSAIEHKAVLEPAKYLKGRGFDLVEAPVTRGGVIDLDALRMLVDDRTLLVSLMAANNETGVIQPVAAAASIARSVGALMHCDAAQAVGRIPINVGEVDVDYLSVSAHKLYGPMGIGALYVAAGAPRPHALIYGGGQEGGIRSGTVPIPLCVGFGVAAQLASTQMTADARFASECARRFVELLRGYGMPVGVMCPDAPRLPGSAAIFISGVDADRLVATVAQEIHLSTGAACDAGQILTSHVHKAMGLSATEAQSCIRPCFGRYNSDNDAVLAASALFAACRRQQPLATGESRQ
jgi:cysteine desulfurase